MILSSIFSKCLAQATLWNDLYFFAIFLSLVYGGLLLLRLLKVFKKKKCPSCSGNLKRKERTPFDRLFTLLMLKILPMRRYKCVHCGWEGLRWNTTRPKPKDSAY